MSDNKITPKQKAIIKQLVAARESTDLGVGAFCKMLRDNVPDCKFAYQTWWRYMTGEHVPSPLQLKGIQAVAQEFIDKKGGG